MKTKAIIHFQTDHILTRFVFPPLQYKRNGKIIVEQLGDSIYPFKGRYTSLYYQIEMGKNEYKLYGYWQISSNEIECDTIIINENEL